MRSLLMVSSLIVALYSCANAQDWRKISPMISTRAEVETLLGPAEGAFAAVYKLKEGSLFIEYSSGLCRPERKGGWNVPENVVVSVSFSPKNKLRVANFKLDPKKFRKKIDQHVIGVIYYVNDDEGITYQVQGGRVDTIEYGPAKKYEHLYCGDPAENPRPSAQETASDAIYSRFEEYYADTSQDKIRELLDAFAQHLKSNPSLKAFLISYGGKHSCRNEALQRARLATRYLSNTHGISSRQSAILNGGYREDWVVELWVGSPGATPPSPTRAINRKQVMISGNCKFTALDGSR